MKASIYTPFFSTLFFLCIVTSLSATRYYFVSSGNWNSSSNWSQGNYPGTSLTNTDSVYLNVNCTLPQNIILENNGFIRAKYDFQIEGTFNNNNKLVSTTSSYIIMDNSGILNNYGKINSSGLFSVWYDGLCTNHGDINFIDCYVINLDTFINKGAITLDIYSDVDNSASFINDTNGSINITGYFGNEFTGNCTNKGSITLVDGGLNNYSVFYNYGTINGNGSIGGSDKIINYAMISPGNSPGVISFQTTLENKPEATITLEIAEAAIGQYDQLSGSGSKILGGTLNLEFLGGYVPQAGDQLMLIEGNISGSFDEINLPPDPPNLYINVVIEANGISINIDQVLSVDLNSFTCAEKSNHVLLEWSTLTEYNNNGFSVEKSLDGRNWEEIHFEEGKGESINPTQYSYEDVSGRSGLNYYRLIQIDYDGKQIISNPISIELSNQVDIKVFPNPVAKYLQIDNKNTEEIIEVFNLNGKEIYRGNTNVLDVSNFTNGLYIIKVRDQVIPFNKN